MPAPPSADANTPLLADLTNCRVVAFDEANRATVYDCQGETTSVTYANASVLLPETLTRVRTMPNGVTEVLQGEYEWTADGAPLLERLRRIVDTVEVATLEWRWTYVGRAIVETRASTEFLETAEDGGNHDDERFTVAGVEAAETVARYSLDGLMLTHEVYAVFGNRLMQETRYEWSEDGRLLRVRGRYDTGTTFGGCDQPSPGVNVCLTTLNYDGGGNLVSFTQDGVERLISDNCCEACAQ